MTQTIPWLIQMEITAGHMPSTSVINMATSKTMMVQATTLWFGETPTAALGVCGLQMGILSSPQRLHLWSVLPAVSLPIRPDITIISTKALILPMPYPDLGLFNERILTDRQNIALLCVDANTI